jgi:hypothetical protein
LWKYIYRHSEKNIVHEIINNENFDFSKNKNLLIPPPYIVAKLKLSKKFDNFTWQYELENMNEYKTFITDKSYLGLPEEKDICFNLGLILNE